MKPDDKDMGTRRDDPARSGTEQDGTGRHDSARSDVGRDGTARHDPARPDGTEPPAHDEEHGGTAMDDDAFDSLRAADPAAGASDPAATVLRAKVDARIGANAPATEGVRPRGTAASDTVHADGTGTSGTGTDIGTDGTAADGTDELAKRRTRRRQPWLVAAAVAGFVAVGGGGYAAGMNGLSIAPTAMDSSAQNAGAEPPIMLDKAEDPAGSGLVPEQRALSQEGAAPGTQEIVPEPGIGPLVYPPTYPTSSRTVFHAGAGLSDDAGESTAYTLDTATGFTEQTAQDAADALGIRSEVRQEDGTWLAGSQDENGATLRISDDGRTSFWFAGEDQLTWRCAEPLPAEPKAPDSNDLGSATCPQQETAGAPSAAVATDEVRRVMTTLGMDADSFEFEGHASGVGTSVVANHVIDGRQTGLRWSGTVTGTGSDVGIAVLNGFLAPVVDLGTYPTVSEREAVERLSDPRFGALGGQIRTLTAMPRGVVSEGSDSATSSGDAQADGSAAGSTASDASTGEPPAPPSAGDPIGWPVHDVTVTEATPGVAQHTLPDGAVVLIPAYELTGDGGTWSVVAVSTGSLDFAVR